MRTVLQEVPLLRAHEFNRTMSLVKKKKAVFKQKEAGLTLDSYSVCVERQVSRDLTDALTMLVTAAGVLSRVGLCDIEESAHV